MSAMISLVVKAALAYDEIFVDGGAAIKIGHACLLPSLSLAMSWRFSQHASDGFRS